MTTYMSTRKIDILIQAPASSINPSELRVSISKTLYHTLIQLRTSKSPFPLPYLYYSVLLITHRYMKMVLLLDAWKESLSDTNSDSQRWTRFY